MFEEEMPGPEIEGGKETEKKPEGKIFKFNIKGEIHKVTNPIDGENLILAEVLIYNVSPIGKDTLLGRMEVDETNSEIVVFEHNEENDTWELQENGPRLPLQDPFHCGTFKNPDGSECHMIGGVKVEWDENKVAKNWKTVFYKYNNDIFELCDNGETIAKPFAEGPDHMKDIRLIQLKNGKIGVFPRPQKEKGFGGLGKIGYFEIDSLDQLHDALEKYSEDQDENTIIPGLFQEDEWGGANELHELKDGSGRIGVLCHKAYFCDPDTGEQIKNRELWERNHPEKKIKKNYEAAAFVYDPKTGKATKLEIIATADDFEDENGEATKRKKDDLGKVIFSGGLVRNENGPACLYVGIGDVAAGNIWIDDPFVKYEEEYRKSHSQREELPKAA